MKRISFNVKNTSLLISGLLLISFSFLLDRWISLTDFQNGIMKGTAIGLLILAVMRRRK